MLVFIATQLLAHRAWNLRPNRLSTSFQGYSFRYILEERESSRRTIESKHEPLYLRGISGTKPFPNPLAECLERLGFQDKEVITESAIEQKYYKSKSLSVSTLQ